VNATRQRQLGETLVDKNDLGGTGRGENRGRISTTDLQFVHVGAENKRERKETRGV